MKSLAILFISCFLITKVYSQSEIAPTTKKINYGIYMQVGQSAFKTSKSAPVKFWTTEAKLGPQATIKINDTYFFQARTSIGAKFKRNSYGDAQSGYTIAPEFIGLNDVISKRNHYFLEVPLTVGVNFRHPKIYIAAGSNFRYYLPNNENVDFLTSKAELGLQAHSGLLLTENINVGFEYFKGLTSLYQISGQFDGRFVHMDVKGYYLSISVSYSF